MKKATSKLLVLVIALVMALGMAPMTAMAADGNDVLHSITIQPSWGGTASSSVGSAAQGTTITLTATPEEGYAFCSWYVEDDLTITDNKFIMPDKDVIVWAVFEASQPHAKEGYTSIWSEDFESGIPSSWSKEDKDGDGFNWKWSGDDGKPAYNFAHHGEWCAFSESYDNRSSSSLSPDNWLYLPEQTLKTNGEYILTFMMSAQDSTSFGDKVGVYISIDGGTNYTQIGDDHVSSAARIWEEIEVNLSDYAGKTVNLAVVHHNSYDQFRTKLDCFNLWEKGGITPVPTPITSVEAIGAQVPVVGASVDWTMPTIPEDADYYLYNDYYAWVETDFEVSDYSDFYDFEADEWRDDCIWYYSDENNELTFQAGKYYTLCLLLGPKEDFVFAPVDDMSGEIDGEEAGVSDFYLSDYLTLFRTFGPLEDGTGSGGEGVTRYILTYESNGGATYPNETYDSGTKVNLNKTPMREGYDFTGWYSDKGATNKITSVTMTENKTVYAGWSFNGPLNAKDHVAYVKGYPDGTVGPSNNITRAETAVMLYRLLTKERGAEITTTENTFSDVTAAKWYNTEVSSMAKGGYVFGYKDGTFGGDKSITRAEFVTMMVRFINPVEGTKTFTDVPTTHWAYKNIATATAVGWIDGYTDGSFGPDKLITRAEAMTIINRVLNRGVDSDSTLLDFKKWPDIKASNWFYYDVIEATNGHDYIGSRPSEDWTKLY